jgi:antirestriction protein
MIAILDLTADIIDVRDIIERYEELENESDGLPNAEERYQLSLILSDLKGAGGDEEWRDDWYPLTLISESHFVDYVREMLEDCGDIPKDLPHYIHIDWKSTARDVGMDYSSVEIDGSTYFYR